MNVWILYLPITVSICRHGNAASLKIKSCNQIYFYYFFYQIIFFLCQRIRRELMSNKMKYVKASKKTIIIFVSLFKW